MKKLLILFTIFLMNGSNVHSQEELYPGELYIPFVNRPANWQFTVKIQAYGTVWDQYLDITSDYNGGDTTYSKNNVIRNSHSSDLDWDNQGWEPVLSLGLYKISIWEWQNQRAWFYLNYRTADFPPHSPTWVDPDLVLEYDVTNKEFEFIYPDLGTVVNGTYYALWELKEDLYQLTSDLTDYWGKCLALITDGYNHPKLIWGPHPSFTTTHFYIYRAIEEIPVNPKNITFSLWAITNASTYELTSYDFVIEVDPTHCAFYYVKAYNSSNSTFSSATNGVSTEGQYIPYKIAIDKPNENQPLGFGLDQNYPNPFNPITTIGYSIKAAGLVTLKVYDMLGTEVASLVNEKKEAGNYSVKFNAENLPSGIYFYQLKSGDITATKKLILLK